MSVKPCRLKDLQHTAVQQHQSLVGKRDYNRYSPLDPRQRTFSVSKRKLDNSDTSNNGQSKVPKFDASNIFTQLEGKDKVLAEVKTSLTQADTCLLELDDTCPPKVKEAFKFLGRALKLLLKSQQNLTSTMLDANPWW
jgi:hypothetical protein